MEITLILFIHDKKSFHLSILGVVIFYMNLRPPGK